MAVNYHQQLPTQLANYLGPHLLVKFLMLMYSHAKLFLDRVAKVYDRQLYASVLVVRTRRVNLPKSSVIHLTSSS
jgi:hypothetical protein